jgi:hypothetical protein
MRGPTGPTGLVGVAGPRGLTGPAGQVGAAGGSIFVATPWPPTNITIPSSLSNADVQNSIVALTNSLSLSPGIIQTILTSTDISPYDIIWTSQNNTLFYTNLSSLIYIGKVNYIMNGTITGDITAPIPAFAPNNSISYNSRTSTLYVAFLAEIWSTRLIFRPTGITGSFTRYTTSTTLLPYVGFADGNIAVAQFKEIKGLAIGSDNSIFVADAGNYCIRKIDPEGNVTTLAGSRSPGLADGIGSLAMFINPTFMAFDSTYSNLYVADKTAVRQININTSNVTTIAGSSTGSSTIVDGNGSSALFSNITGIAVDKTDTVYVADNGTWSIRKIQFVNIIVNSNTSTYQNVYKVSTISGYLSRSITPGTVTTGDAAQATYNFPCGIALDDASSLYIADRANKSIRVIGASTFTAQQLNVNSLKTGIIYSPSAPNAIIYADPSGSYYTSSSSLTYTNNSLFVDGLSLSSDSRIKQDILPLSNSLEAVERLRPVSYTRVDETSGKKHLGFIAQEMEEVYPEVVHTDSAGMKSIGYANLTAVLVDSVKGLHSEVRALQSTVSGLRRID